MTDTISIPLNKLLAWNGNVRKTAGADTALAELAASIVAHGLINIRRTARHHRRAVASRVKHARKTPIARNPQFGPASFFVCATRGPARHPGAA